jgi:hypothetical protein
MRLIQGNASIAVLARHTFGLIGAPVSEIPLFGLPKPYYTLIKTKSGGIPNEVAADFALNIKGLFGGRTRTRTVDPLIKSQLLCQLSYAPERMGV